MSALQTIEVPIAGMDCAECTQHVQHAIEKLPGVQKVEVFLGSEKALVALDSAQVDLAAIRQAVASAGYSVPETEKAASAPIQTADFNRRLTRLLVGMFVGVLSIAIIGEWLGAFEILNERVPFVVGLVLVLAGGYPVLANVVRATLKRQITAHTLMTLGLIAALVVGEWVTAAIVVLFMSIGDYVERFTTESARRAVKELTALAPQTARLEREGFEQEVPLGQVQAGDTVVVRPGEKIPVDGEVLSGQATLDQAAISGESLPVEVTTGGRVYAATIAKLGSLRIKVVRVGAETTFGRVIKMVEQAEANRAEVQRFADKFSGYYLPVVAGIALLTYIIRRDPLATAAVLVVACSCSIALATPIAMLASIGASAKRGLLIKGGKYLEALAQADVLLVDKTGTLTLGRPEVTDVVLLDRRTRSEALQLAATAERYSEHPLAEAVRELAQDEAIALSEAQDFKAVPGQGVSAQVAGHQIIVGNGRLLPAGLELEAAKTLEAQGKTLLFLEVDGVLTAILAAADTLRTEAPAAIQAARQLGIRQVELLTGDNERTAAALAEKLGVSYRAGLLPEDKIAIVQEYQAKGHIVLMVGDGVNDAPALAQANVGIAMGAAGTDVAIEAAHIALMREDWSLVPEALKIARRTMGVVRMNLGFTAIYNIVGLALAASGILPPALAAAAQSLPDIGIMGNSARLIRQK